MQIPNALASLLASTARDAVLYQEQLLKSETLRNRADYEEHHLQLIQFFEFVKEKYKSVESEAGIPLEQLL